MVVRSQRPWAAEGIGRELQELVCQRKVVTSSRRNRSILQIQIVKLSPYANPSFSFSSLTSLMVSSEVVSRQRRQNERIFIEK